MRASRTIRTPDSVAALIATRRRQLGWSLARLARSATLQSPAYVFHIENGHKLPSEEVAIRLATALGLDPELLRAWSRARGRSDLESALLAARTLTRLLDPEGTEQPRAIALDPGGAQQPRAAAHAHDVLHVPLLPEGVDPAERDDAELPAIEVLRLDARLFPPHATALRPVAYRLSARGARRASGLVSAGDCIVVARDGEPPALDHLAAIRSDGRVEIVRWSEPGLPGRVTEANSDARVSAHVVPFEGLVGRVVLAFRRWL